MDNPSSMEGLRVGGRDRVTRRCDIQQKPTQCLHVVRLHDEQTTYM